MKKIFLFIAIFTVALAIAGPQGTRAEGICDLSIPVAELKAVQAGTSLNELDELHAEILARRKLLTAAIDCDQADIAARVDAFSRLPDKIKTVEAYRKILEGMAEASRYYDGHKAPIETLGVWDLKTSSRAIAAWRKTTYLPLITWADNFLLWADNQQFLEKASERLAQVSKVAFSLKLVNQDKIDGLFQKAQTNFDMAFKENDMAKEALDQKRPASGLAHTQASLKALADTYQIFFELQEALQEIAK